MIRTLIIDDVQLARERLKRCLAVEPDVEIVGECDNSAEAVASTASFMWRSPTTAWECTNNKTATALD